MKLYRSADYPTDWFAFSAQEQWVRFPAKPGGWAMRQPIGYGAMNLIDKHQIPLWLGFNTGIPGAQYLSKAGVRVTLSAAA